MLSSEHVKLLKQFVELSSKNPDILHDPSLDFYREYLLSFGAKIPHKTTGTTENDAKDKETVEDDEPEIPYPELDNSGVISGDNDEPLPMGDASKEVTDEEKDQADEKRNLAAEAFNEGDYDKSLKQYTAAIELNPGSALLHAKRANVLLKLSKPLAAIRDCDKAIALNPDSSAGYKFRGRAYRLLGKWSEAHKDLVLACKIDYDDTAAEWLKEVEPNAKKLTEYNRAKQRQVNDKENRERQERVRRAQEANKRAAEESKDSGHDFGFGNASGPGNPFNDPEIVKLLKDDPSLMNKILDVMQNPQSLMKYMNDPVVMKLIQKFTSKSGSSFPFGNNFGAEPSAPGGAKFDFDDNDVPPFDIPSKDDYSKPKKAPEPDLD